MSVLPILPQGFVVGRILTSRGDSADADKKADTAVVVGMVDFTPATAYRKIDAATVVTHSKITAKLDSHGDLHPQREMSDNTGSDTEDGIWLPVGTWKVTYRLNTGFGALPEHHIEVTTAHTEAAPLPLFANLGDPAPSGATLVQLTVPLGGQQGQVLVMNDGSLAWGTPSGGGGGSSTIAADDTPAAPAEGESASYLVTSAVSWPAGLVWSTDPDGGVAPTITGTALVSLFTVSGVTRAIMGATFPGVVPDTTAPAWPATLTIGTPSMTSVVVTASSLATDAVGVTGYEYSINNGSTWTAVAPSGLNFTLTGLVAATSYPAPQFRAKDAAGNISPVLSAQPFTTASPAADTTPPTVGTMAASSITDTGFTLTVTGASDETGLDAAPYAFTTNGGTTWSAYQSSNVYTAAGLAPGTDYTVNWRVRDGFGNVAPGTAQTVTTTGTAWTPAGVDGLHIWYDPSDTATVTVEEGAVTGILDKSPNGFNATAPTEAARGTIGTIGGLQALALTKDQKLTGTTPTWSMTDQMTVFMVVAQAGTNFKYAARLGFLRFGVGGATWRLIHRTAFADYGTASTAATTRGGVADTTGVFQRIGATESAPSAAGTTGGNGDLIEIGDDAAATIGEVIVIVGRDVPLAERDQIHAYLAAKWGTA